MSQNQDEITGKQLLFCQEFIIDLNGTQAAIRAGYSENTAQAQASRMLSYVKVQTKITELKAQRAERTQVEADDIVKQLDLLRKANISEYVELASEIVVTGIDDKGEEIKKEVQHLIFKDFKDLTEDQLSCIESIKHGKNGLELKLHGKEWTIEKLNRHIGFYEKDNDQSKPPVVITGIEIIRTNGGGK